MLRYCFASALLCAATIAHASGYSDFSTGIGAFERGDADQAIAALSKAIDAGDLAPNLLPTAYLDRGLSYLSRGLAKSAEADLTMAQKLDPGAPGSYGALGLLHEREGDFAAAVHDYTGLVAVAVNPAYALTQRGRANWEAANFVQALADMEKGLDGNRSPSAYDLLWARVASGSAQTPLSKSLANKEDDEDLIKWPGPVLAAFRGSATEEAVINAAHDVNENVQRAQICEADFYLAELKREQSNFAAAQTGFSAAVKECPVNFVEYPAARAALKFENPAAKTVGEKL